MKKSLGPKLKKWAVGLAVIGLGAGAQGWAQNPTDAGVSSGVIGFERVLPGEGWRAVGPPLEPFALARMPVVMAQQNVLSLDISAEAGPWEVDQWSGYELAVGGGLAAGRRYQIGGNGPDWLVLESGSDPALDGVLPGDLVSIAPTLEEYLSGQIISGPANASDWVAAFYRNVLVKLHRDAKGQWMDDQGNPARLSVACGRGFLINLLPGNGPPRGLLLAGQWNGDAGGGYITGGQQIISVPLSGTPRVLDALIGVGLQAGTSPAAGDQLTVLNDLTGDDRTCALDGKGQWRWLDTGDPSGALVIEPGRGYFYSHTGTGFSWHWR
jgi:hypothetical protein